MSKTRRKPKSREVPSYGTVTCRMPRDTFYTVKVVRPFAFIPKTRVR